MEAQPQSSVMAYHDSKAFAKGPILDAEVEDSQ